MSKVRVVLDRKGVQNVLLKGPEVAEFMESIGNDAIRRLGDGYKMDRFTGKRRTNVEVRASTRETIRENLKNNTLLKAVWSK